ncbi:MAG: hypothetical protein EBT13_10965 [Rhodobacteraceae bacterium]|nr:hypothetical protein [Paracoccaceae bacterium]
MLELIKGMQRRERAKAGAEFWFMKRGHCRDALKVSMQGKTNRKGKGKGKKNGSDQATSILKHQT